MTVPTVVDRPLSIPEILDRSITLTVKRWRPLVILALIFSLARAISLVAIPRSTFSAPISGLALHIVLDPLIIPAVVLISAPIAAPRLSVALREALRRYGANVIAVLFANMLVGVTIVAVVLVTLPLFLYGPVFVFQAIDVLLITVLVSIPALLGGIMYPIITLENASPRKAITVGVRRIRNAGVWRSFRLGFTLVAFDYFPGTIANAVTTRIDVLAKMPATLPLERALVGGVTTVYIAVLITVISLEMTVRHEGSDIEAALEMAPSAAGSKEVAVESA